MLVRTKLFTLVPLRVEALKDFLLKKQKQNAVEGINKKEKLI